jgi:hypothetical protein
MRLIFSLGLFWGLRQRFLSRWRGFAIEHEDEARAFLDLQLVAVDLALDGRAWRTGKS